MAEEFWRWMESRWDNPEIDWKDGAIISAGVDVGSVSSQAVVMVDGELYAYGNTRTGSNSPDSAINAMDMALEGTGMTIDDLQYTVGTGYGRVNVPFGQRAITEIACHGRGANFMYGPTIRTVLDMGGQDCKAILVDQKGKVSNFLMNDKCAAGTGRGMEVFADLLGVSINEVGEMSLRVEKEPDRSPPPAWSLPNPRPPGCSGPGGPRRKFWPPTPRPWPIGWWGCWNGSGWKPSSALPEVSPRTWGWSAG